MGSSHILQGRQNIAKCQRQVSKTGNIRLTVSPVLSKRQIKIFGVGIGPDHPSLIGAQVTGGLLQSNPCNSQTIFQKFCPRTNPLRRRSANFFFLRDIIQINNHVKH